MNHFPYMPFPRSWPVFVPKDMLANSQRDFIAVEMDDRGDVTERHELDVVLRIDDVLRIVVFGVQWRDEDVHG